MPTVPVRFNWVESVLVIKLLGRAYFGNKLHVWKWFIWSYINRTLFMLPINVDKSTECFSKGPADSVLAHSYHTRSWEPNTWRVVAFFSFWGSLFPYQLFHGVFQYQLFILFIPHESSCFCWQSANIDTAFPSSINSLWWWNSHLITINNLKEFDMKAALGWKSNCRGSEKRKHPPQCEQQAICMPKKTITNWTNFYAEMKISLSGLIMEG